MRLRAIKPFDSGTLGFKHRGEEFDADELTGRGLVAYGLAEIMAPISSEPINKVVQTGKVLLETGSTVSAAAPDPVEDAATPLADAPPQPQSTSVRRGRK